MLPIATNPTLPYPPRRPLPAWGHQLPWPQFDAGGMGWGWQGPARRLPDPHEPYPRGGTPGPQTPQSPGGTQGMLGSPYGIPPRAPHPPGGGGGFEEAAARPNAAPPMMPPFGPPAGWSFEAPQRAIRNGANPYYALV